MVASKASVSLSTKEYVSHVVALPHCVVAALTDSSVMHMPLTLDEAAISTFYKPSNDIPMAGMVALPTTPMAIVTCNAQGQLKTWDLRTRIAQQQLDALDSNLTVTALGVSNFGELAIGMEASPDAEIFVYDVRQIKSAKPLVKYKDSHNDDITDLQFHPSQRNHMLSGSTDGVINWFDISISDEDEAVIEAFNHQASIHRTGFLSDSVVSVQNLDLNSSRHDSVFGLSHMETLTVYPTNTSDKANQEFGDLREAWSCQYVADYKKQHFLIGSNDNEWAGLVPFLNGEPQPIIKLDKGHGSEVVRCFDLASGSGACFTGGEDGTVKLWDVTKKFDEVNTAFDTLSTKHKTSKSGKSKRSSKVHRHHQSDPLRKHKHRKGNEEN